MNYLWNGRDHPPGLQFSSKPSTNHKTPSFWNHLKLCTQREAFLYLLEEFQGTNRKGAAPNDPHLTVIFHNFLPHQTELTKELNVPSTKLTKVSRN